MKQYRLLKDLPTFKAGQLAYVSSLGNLMAGTPEEPETADTGLNLMIYHRVTLEKFPNILTEWFEKIEPTDSIHWKPKFGDIYWRIDSDGEIVERRWQDDEINKYDYLSANAYKCLEEIEQASERKLAEVRLQRTSTFEPDFENGNGGYVVDYDYTNQKLECYDLLWNDSGEIVRYETREEAEKSIRENEQDWKIYFGIKEEE